MGWVLDPCTQRGRSRQGRRALLARSDTGVCIVDCVFAVQDRLLARKRTLPNCEAGHLYSTVATLQGHGLTGTLYGRARWTTSAGTCMDTLPVCLYACTCIGWCVCVCVSYVQGGEILTIMIAPPNEHPQVSTNTLAHTLDLPACTLSNVVCVCHILHFVWLYVLCVCHHMLRLVCRCAVCEKAELVPVFVHVCVPVLVCVFVSVCFCVW